MAHGHGQQAHDVLLQGGGRQRLMHERRDPGGRVELRKRGSQALPHAGDVVVDEGQVASHCRRPVKGCGGRPCQCPMGCRT